MRLLIATLSLLITVIAPGVHADVLDIRPSDHDIAQLNKLATYIDNGSSEKNLMGPARSKSFPVRALSAALLYRGRPNIHRAALYEAFTVNDYAARRRGEYHFVSKETMLDAIRQVERRYPQITDQRVQLLLVFSHFRDKNAWIRTNDGDISLARFFRSAFLAAVYKGTDLDAVAIADSMDRKAQQR